MANDRLAVAWLGLDANKRCEPCTLRKTELRTSREELVLMHGHVPCERFFAAYALFLQFILNAGIIHSS